MKEALKLALEALESKDTWGSSIREAKERAITAIKEALAQDEKGLFIDLIAQHEGLAEELALTSTQCEVQDEQSSSQEPVAWSDEQMIQFASMVLIQGRHHDSIEMRLNTFRSIMVERGTSHPPKRPWGKPWVSLTDEEMQALWDRCAHMEMMRAIEAKLKELNT